MVNLTRLLKRRSFKHRGIVFIVDPEPHLERYAVSIPQQHRLGLTTRPNAAMVGDQMTTVLTRRGKVTNDANLHSYSTRRMANTDEETNWFPIEWKPILVFITLF